MTRVWTTGGGTVIDTVALRALAGKIEVAAAELGVASAEGTKVGMSFGTVGLLVSHGIAALERLEQCVARCLTLAGNLHNFHDRLLVTADSYDDAEGKVHAHTGTFIMDLLSRLKYLGLCVPTFAVGKGVFSSMGIRRGTGLEGAQTAWGIEALSAAMGMVSLGDTTRARGAALLGATWTEVAAVAMWGPATLELQGEKGKTRLSSSAMLEYMPKHLGRSALLIGSLLEHPQLVLGPGVVGVMNAVQGGGRKTEVVPDLARLGPLTSTVKFREVPPRAPEMVGYLDKIDCERTGHIKILEHRTGDKVAWTVLVRGMQTYQAGGHHPHGMATNLQEVAGMRSDQQRLVVAAMNQAGIKPGEPVELVGHSQGASVVTSLAADPVVQKRYHVTSVLAVGGPTAGGVQKHLQNVNVLHVRDISDAVPSLDGAATEKGILTLHADTTGDNSQYSAHSRENYQHILDAAETQKLPDVQQWEQKRLHSLGINKNTQTTAHDFYTARKFPAQQVYGKVGNKPKISKISSDVSKLSSIW
ncbi:MAG: hypothetical protein Q4A71_05795 [Actinomycetaceae bacterium]|nr:hypothetical protein [Actinomycetaceae bacterium]